MAGEDFLIHEKISGMLAIERKEELQIAYMISKRRAQKGWGRRISI